MTATTRRKLLGAGLFTALVAVAGVAVAQPDPDARKRPCREAMEADLLRFYRDASATEKAAILRLMERTLAGDDMHAVSVELMVAFGADEAEAHRRAAAALANTRKRMVPV